MKSDRLLCLVQLYLLPLSMMLKAALRRAALSFEIPLYSYTLFYIFRFAGYPTIKWFPAGKKDGDANDYDGGRTASDIVSWAMEKYGENIPPPEVKQVSNTPR